MKSFPFTSQVTYDEQGLPLYDRAVDSTFLREVYSRYFSDGVFCDPSDSLQVVADTGMKVRVMPGACHIRGAVGIETQQRTLAVQAAEAQDRIDTVVARLDLTLAVRSVDLYVVKGTPAESPQPPALTRDSTIWELGLANLFVAKNVSTISQQRITDTRLDTARCGQVGASVQPPFDTQAYFAQLEAAIRAHQTDAEAQIEQLRKAIEDVQTGAAWLAKDIYDPQDGRIDVTVQTYAHTKSGTVHNFAGSGANGRAKLTANVAAGDTFTVNGAQVTAYMGAESAAAAMAGSAWNGRWVSFVVDGATLNFKGGGGLSATDGAKLIPENIKAGVTLFAGTPKQVIGSFTNDANAVSGNVLIGKIAYAKGVKIVGSMPDKSNTIIRIPFRGPDSNVGGYILSDNLRDVWVVPAVGYYSGYNHTVRRLEINGPELASAVGLTPDKLRKGTAVLGVTGTMVPSPEQGSFVAYERSTLNTAMLGSNILGSWVFNNVSGIMATANQNGGTGWFPNRIDMTAYRSLSIRPHRPNFEPDQGGFRFGVARTTNSGEFVKFIDVPSGSTDPNIGTSYTLDVSNVNELCYIKVEAAPVASGPSSRAFTQLIFSV